MFKDEHRYDVCSEIQQHDVRAFSEILTPALFAEAAVRTGVVLVKSPLCLVNLVWLGVLCAMHATDSFATVLGMTLKLLEDQENFSKTPIGKAKKEAQRKKAAKNRSKHDPRRNDPTKVTEEAFAKARQRMPIGFWINLIVLLGVKFEAEHGHWHRFRGFRILAMDGTRIDLPHWKALKDHFGAAKNKSGSHNPQARMVLLQFPFTRLPCHYRLAPLSVGETTLALELMPYLTANDLVLLDAGYWSYQLLWAISNREAFFAIRLRKRLRLKTLRRLRPDGKDSLVRWTPQDSRGQWRKLKLPKSIDLRVVRYQVPGFRSQAIVTNVLDPKKISRDDWTRLTTDCTDARRKLLPGLFHRRWEIETTYHELKVDQGLDRHLRSRTVESIEYEVAGHVVYYLLVRYLMVKAAVTHGLDPIRLSFVEAQRELRLMRPSLACASPRWVATVLLPRLLERIAQHPVPVRAGRHYERKKAKRAKKRKTKRRSNAATKRTKARPTEKRKAKRKAKVANQG